MPETSILKLQALISFLNASSPFFIPLAPKTNKSKKTCPEIHVLEWSQLTCIFFHGLDTPNNTLRNPSLLFLHYLSYLLLLVKSDLKCLIKKTADLVIMTVDYRDLNSFSLAAFHLIYQIKKHISCNYYININQLQF